MTHFLHDILRQPQELKRALGHRTGPAGATRKPRRTRVRKARHVYLTGMGSSWHAAFGAGAIFSRAGRPVYMQDAGELVQFATFPVGSLVITISRSGRSTEIVQLLAKARESGATVVGITNSADGVLAQEADLSILDSVLA